MDYTEHEFTYSRDGLGPLDVVARIEHNAIAHHAVTGEALYDDSVSEFTAENENGEDVSYAMKGFFVRPHGKSELISVYEDIENEALVSWLKS